MSDAYTGLAAGGKPGQTGSSLVIPIEYLNKCLWKKYHLSTGTYICDFEAGSSIRKKNKQAI